MASREELLAQARRKRLMEQATAKRAAESTQAPVAPEDSGISTMDTVRGAIESFNEGTTLGYGDEIVGAGRAALDYVNPSSWGEDAQSFGDKYEMYRDDQRKAKSQFAKENPKTALGLSLAGGVASPANLVGPGLQAAKGVSALKTAAQLGTRGGIEGAIAGAGSAEELSDIPEAMLKGGLVGGTFSGTVGGLGRGLISRKVAQELGKGENAIPLHMIDAETPVEHGIQSGYKNIVGRLPFSKGKMIAQEEPILKRAIEDAADKGAMLKAQKSAVTSGENILKANEKTALKKTLAKVDDDLAKAQAAMRSNQGSRAIPDYGTPESAALKAQVAAEPDPYKANTILREFYGRDGPAFKSVTSQEFEVDDKLARMLENKFPDGLDGIEDLDDLVGETMSGRALMELRNEPAIKAAKTTGQPYGSYRKDVKEFDTHLERLLNNAGIGTKEFRADKKAYPAYKAFNQAVEKAEDLDGVFTGKNLAKTGRARDRAINKSEGQILGKPVRKAERDAKVLKKALKDDLTVRQQDPYRKSRLKERGEKISEEMKGVTDKLSATKKKGIAENVTFPSQMATAIGLGLTVPFGGAAAIPAILAGGRAMTTGAVQRGVAGQTAFQKAFQDSDRLKLMAQLLRQSGSRKLAKEEEEY